MDAQNPSSKCFAASFPISIFITVVQKSLTNTSLHSDDILCVQ